MSSPILFRSKKVWSSRTGQSVSPIQARGTSWSHLRSHNEADDVRDIAWHKIRPESLYVRSREDRGEFSVVWYYTKNIYDAFKTQEFPTSKGEYKERLSEVFRSSCAQENITYQEYSNLPIHTFIRLHPRNMLIIVSDSIVDKKLQELAHHNDVIYLDILHPFEIYPTPQILFLWKTVSQKYARTFEKSIENKKKLLRRMHIAYIPIYTNEKANIKLNDFFKNRFKQR